MKESVRTTEKVTIGFSHAGTFQYKSLWHLSYKVMKISNMPCSS